MSSWNDFLSAVEVGAAQAARTALHGFEAEATADTKAFLQQSEADLKGWTDQLARGQIDADDLRDFVQADLAVAAMTALTQAGIISADIDRLREELVDVVVSAASKSFLPTP